MFYRCLIFTALFSVINLLSGCGTNVLHIDMEVQPIEVTENFAGSVSFFFTNDQEELKRIKGIVDKEQNHKELDKYIKNGKDKIDRIYTYSNVPGSEQGVKYYEETNLLVATYSFDFPKNNVSKVVDLHLEIDQKYGWGLAFVKADSDKYRRTKDFSLKPDDYPTSALLLGLDRGDCYLEITCNSKESNIKKE